MKSIIKALFYWFMWFGCYVVFMISWDNWSLNESILCILILFLAQCHFCFKMMEEAGKK